jgi:predicted ribosome quality control (RQC) complex YloA/Tae2 family protein
MRQEILYVLPSDANLKNNITDINNPLASVLKMHGVTYNFKDVNRFGGNRQMGFLAQELETIVPEAVSSGGEYKSVNYQVLTALLTEAVKEQQKQIDLEKKNNQALQKSNLELQNEVAKIKKQLEDKMLSLEIKLNELLTAKEKAETAKN